MSKYLFVVGALLIILSGLSIISNHLGFAQRILVYAFWIFLGGVLFYIREVKHEN